MQDFTTGAWPECYIPGGCTNVGVPEVVVDQIKICPILMNIQE